MLLLSLKDHLIPNDSSAGVAHVRHKGRAFSDELAVWIMFVLGGERALSEDRDRTVAARVANEFFDTHRDRLLLKNKGVFDIGVEEVMWSDRVRRGLKSWSERRR